MKSEWTKKKLSDIADFNPRETIKKGAIAKKIPMDVLRPFYRDISYYVEECFSGGTKFRNGDTIMARITPCLENGKTAQVSILNDGEVGFGSTEYIVFRAKEGIADKDYLYYLVCSPEVREPAIKSMVGSSGRQRVQTDVVKNLEIDVPPLVDQEKIGSFLKSFDDKIALNDKINNNLELQAAALFTNFYDQAETEIGFTEIIQILGGGTPKTGESSYWNGDIPFFTPKDVGSPYTLTTEKTITEEGLAHCNSRLYPINTVFVTARGTVGKVSLPGAPMAMNQSCYALVGKDTPQLLVYFYTLKAVDRLKHKASGAVFDAITTRDFEAENIMKLSNDDTKAFLDVAEPIYQAVLNNSIENLRLAELRDSLLPKLMSVELDVSNIDL